MDLVEEGVDHVVLDFQLTELCAEGLLGLTARDKCGDPIVEDFQDRPRRLHSLRTVGHSVVGGIVH